MSAVAMDYPKYDSYKDSGVDWLGEIPSDWDLMRFKYIFREINDRSETGNEELLSVSQYTGVTKRADNVSTEILTNAESLEGYKKVKQNQLVSNIMLAWNGSLAFSNFDGIVSPAYSVYELNNNFDSRFFNYLVRSETYKAEYKRKSTGVVESRLRLYTEKFYNIWCSFPQKEIQTEVANFLDEKTAQIEQAIALKQQQIDKLNEYKQIVIQNAVTKGLNPNALMKNSGVEWIGEIPQHWEVRKVKYLSEIFRGKFTHRPRNDPALYDGKYPFFQTGDVAQAGKFLSKYRQTLNEKGLRVSTLIPKGTIIITIAANIGDVAILDIDACFPDSLVGFKPFAEIERDFLYYSLINLKEQFLKTSIKNTQMNLNVERIGEQLICLPPLDEQCLIIDYIEKLNQKFNKSVTNYQSQIDRLKEYKNILINQAVTGKIKIDL